MKKAEGKRAARVGARSAQRTTKSLPTIEQRAQTIISNVDHYDIDTRQAVLVAFKNLTFYQNGAGGYYPAEQLPALIAEGERELREMVTRVEAGERVTESYVPEEYDAAARAVLGLLETEAIPDFFKGGIYTLLDLFAADTGAKLWQETTEGDGETGGYSTDLLARMFAHHSLHRLQIERKKDLAEIISAVVNHPDTPVEIFDALTARIGEFKYDKCAPEFIRHALAYEPEEQHGCN
jgi:hypothetical protein